MFVIYITIEILINILMNICTYININIRIYNYTYVTKVCHEKVLSFFRNVPEVLSLGLTLSWGWEEVGGHVCHPNSWSIGNSTSILRSLKQYCSLYSLSVSQGHETFSFQTVWGPHSFALPVLWAWANHYSAFQYPQRETVCDCASVSELPD